jgi:antitoxin component YwqK of YwqJK toxin-antitoxin module
METAKPPTCDVDVISYLLEFSRKWPGNKLTFYYGRNVEMVQRVYDAEKGIIEQYYMDARMQRHGPYRRTMNGILLLSTNYINNEEEKINTEYTENGQLYSISQMKQGVRHGLHVKWNEGKIIEKSIYSYGMLTLVTPSLK